MIARRVAPYDLIARVLAERLQGRAASAALRAIVRSRKVDWQRVVGDASAEFVLPAFAAAARDLELTGALDPDLGAFLEAIHAANLGRNGELRDELAAAVGVLNRAGIEPLLLKGAIRLVDGLYPDDGWRVLRDLDLLVPGTSLPEAVRAFAQAGYRACGPDHEVRRPQGPCQIDLHGELFSASSQVRLLPAADMLNEARLVALGNGTIRIPSVEHQLVHLIGHGQIRHQGHAFGRIRLRNLLEAAALVRREQQSIDWQAVSARFAAAGFRRPLLSLLLALNGGAWCTVPVTAGIDRITALQHRRIKLQARSTTFAYVGSRAGWWISVFKSQIENDETGRPRALRNLERLALERGALGRLARALAGRHRQLLHVLPHLVWLVAQ